MQFLIGTDGRRWLPFGREFTRHVGFSGSWEENVDFAVRRHGQVSLHLSPRRYRVRLQPEALTWGAFQQLISVLLDDDAKPVVLDIEAASDHLPTEIYANVDDAIARIDDLRAMNAQTGGPQWRASFIDEPLSIQRLRPLGQPSPLKTAYRSWVRRRGQLSAPLLSRLLGSPLTAPMLLARIGKDGRPVAETWPSFLKLYTDEQVPKLLGQPLEEHPLVAFSELSARGYQAVGRDQSPRLALIEAVVPRPNGKAVRIRYERLLLPWRAADGTRFVGSTIRQIWQRETASPIC